ncbi:MAG: hypothetical protein KatS3mg031_0079 [Chitinophagales bacterium]|nr:MAG: hypothetical protein KatS3mg031_0079 [Chitinophagales bacterium]
MIRAHRIPPYLMEVMPTADKSHTIYIPHLKEQFHSIHGAIQESMHVFIEAGLRYLAQNKTRLSILEVGMGTGLNVLLSYMNGMDCVIHYVALEPFPLSEEIIAQLNYGQITGYAKVFFCIHASPWNADIALSDTFYLKKIDAGIEDFKSERQFDLVYFDAFSPRVQPQIWTVEVFSKLMGLLTPGGVWVSYCARGSVKRSLSSVGFQVETLPGAAGKREMIRAVKPIVSE